MSNYEQTEMTNKVLELTDPDGEEFHLNMLEAMQVGEPGMLAIFSIRQAIHLGRIPADSEDAHDHLMDTYVEPFYDKLDKTVRLLIENYVKGLIDINQNCTCIECKRREAKYN